MKPKPISFHMHRLCKENIVGNLLKEHNISLLLLTEPSVAQAIQLANEELQFKVFPDAQVDLIFFS